MQPRRARFGSQARLRSSQEFRRVFAEGRRVVTSGLVVIAAPRASEGASARMGLAIAKRRVARAVDRNRIKRVLRESFRLVRDELPDIDIVILARDRTRHMSNGQLFAELAYVWRRTAADRHLKTSASPASSVNV